MLDCKAADAYVRESSDNENGVATLVDAEGCHCLAFRHPLPGHPACLVELQTPSEREAAQELGLARGRSNPQHQSLSRFQILGELLAEGWSKSLTNWHRKNQLPIRFN